MKKFAIMFVMLLGSVATMQAQTNTTFDFSCETVNPNDLDGNGFETIEEADLDTAEFEQNVQHPGTYNLAVLGGIAPNTFIVNVSIIIFNEQFRVRISDVSGYEDFATLALALDYVDNFDYTDI